MTKITLFRTEDTYIGFRVDGHSGYADAGEDIVCAGISVLVINFINSVEKFTDDKFEVNVNDDMGLIEFRLADNHSDKSRLLLNSLVLGLEDLTKENTDFISLNYKEV